MAIGYQHLILTLDLAVAAQLKPCMVDEGVQVLVDSPEMLRVPLAMAVESHDLMGHILFALKHQGIQLEVLQAIFLKIEPDLIQALLTAKPNGKYVRQIGFLYEYFTGVELAIDLKATSYVDLFDSRDYITGPDRRNTKYRVNQNGLGNLDFCPMVRRTPELMALMQRNLFAELDSLVQQVGGTRHIDRALGWAYLDETRSSFDIEDERPSQDKAERFIQLLHQAHQAQDLSENYLSELQSSVITNPFLQELSFRQKQNWLQRGSRQFRASDVTYIPPSPEHNQQLMSALMSYANENYPADANEALIKSLLVSFGFVFNHPFLDGNGRISRFLIHHGLCRARLLVDGLILPISVALSQHETGYLRCLESVSSPIRKLWRVNQLLADGVSIDATFIGSADPYRYFDGTEIAEFGLKMAHYALDHSLIQELSYLEKFDVASQRINSEYDLRKTDVINLIRMIESEGGRLSKRRRKQYADRVLETDFDGIEAIVQEIFFPELDK